jgi:hypothetical protein
MSDRQRNNIFWGLLSIFGVAALSSILVAGKKMETIENNAIQIEKCEQKMEQHSEHILYIRENMITKEDLREAVIYLKNND